MAYWKGLDQGVNRALKPRLANPNSVTFYEVANEFDISKFQLLVFQFGGWSGANLFRGQQWSRCAQDFSAYEIPAEYLGLIGLSQVVYIGGKAVGPNTKGDLDKKLNEVRDMETMFVNAVARTWNESGATADRTLGGAKNAALDEYNAYRLRAAEAATMVGECIGTTVNESSIEPAIPNA